MVKNPTIKQQVNLAVAHAHHAVLEGEKLRRRLRRKVRPGAPNRQDELLDQLDSLAIYGNDLRRLSGKIQWPQCGVDESDEQKLRDASAELDRERRKLRKMLR